MLEFSPRLIGQTEKTLGAVLDGLLAAHALRAGDWICLQLAARSDGATRLAVVAADQAQLDDAAELVVGLERRGLVAADRLTDAGRSLVSEIAASVDEIVGPVWQSLDPDDVTAAERVLNAVLDRLRERLAPGRQG